MVENSYNFGVYWIIKILSVLGSTHMISWDEVKFVFYGNNYINWDYYNQLYDPD